MQSTIIKIIGGIIVALGLLACSQHSIMPPMEDTLLEKNWGRSYESAKYNQILNPEAGKNTAPVEGLDGDAAKRTMDNYKSGGAPQQKPATEFGVVTIKQ